MELLRLNILLGLDKSRVIRNQPYNSEDETPEQSKEDYYHGDITRYDIGRHIGDSLADVLENSGDIARSYRKNTITPNHLLIGLIEYFVDKEVDSELKEVLGTIKVTLIENADRGSLFVNFLNRKNSILVSEKVEQVLKDSLNVTASTGSDMISPKDVFITLIESGLTEITYSFNVNNIPITEFTERIRNEL